MPTAIFSSVMILQCWISWIRRGYLQPETRTAFSDREIVLTTHAQEEGHANVEAFYEFLLSDQAQQIMNESFDSMAAESTDSGVSSESASAVS